MDKNTLIKEAMTARQMSYSPYSHFKVGAALLGIDGKIYRGCNIEGASFSPTTCAERTALLKAVSEGVKEFTAIAVIGGHESEINEVSTYAAPCGVCRQFLYEFNDGEMTVIIAKSENDYTEMKLKDLLPLAFTPKDLEV